MLPSPHVPLQRRSYRGASDTLFISLWKEQHKTLTKRYMMDLEAIEEEKSRFREELERFSELPPAFSPLNRFRAGLH